MPNSYILAATLLFFTASFAQSSPDEKSALFELVQEFRFDGYEDNRTVSAHAEACVLKLKFPGRLPCGDGGKIREAIYFYNMSAIAPGSLTVERSTRSSLPETVVHFSLNSSSSSYQRALSAELQNFLKNEFSDRSLTDFIGSIDFSSAGTYRILYQCDGQLHMTIRSSPELLLVNTQDRDQLSDVLQESVSHCNAK